MTVELVTGHAGTGHIDGFDVGGLIGGIAGDGDYVLQEPYGTISCTVKDNNHVIIGKGDLIMSGRHVRIEDSETLTVQSGTQGQQRHDLVVMRYTRQSSGIETAELQVLRGTPGHSSTPGYNTGSILNGATTRDMPLYRLDLNGISLNTAPARLFSTFTPVSSITPNLSKQINRTEQNLNNKISQSRQSASNQISQSERNLNNKISQAQQNASNKVSKLQQAVNGQIASVNGKIDNISPWDASKFFTASKGWEIGSLQCRKIGSGPWVLLTCTMKRTETWTCEAWKKSTMLTMPSWLGAANDTTSVAASNGSAEQGGNLYVTVNTTQVNVLPAIKMVFPTGRWVSFSMCWLAES